MEENEMEVYKKERKVEYIVLILTMIFLYY